MQQTEPLALYFSRHTGVRFLPTAPLHTYLRFVFLGTFLTQDSHGTPCRGSSSTKEWRQRLAVGKNRLGRRPKETVAKGLGGKHDGWFVLQLC